MLSCTIQLSHATNERDLACLLTERDGCSPVSRQELGLGQLGSLIASEHQHLHLARRSVGVASALALAVRSNFWGQCAGWAPDRGFSFPGHFVAKGRRSPLPAAWFSSGESWPQGVDGGPNLRPGPEGVPDRQHSETITLFDLCSAEEQPAHPIT